MDWIPPSLRIHFRDFCSGLYLRQIDAIFQSAGFSPGQIPSEAPPISGERRTRVAEYYASIDWNNLKDCQKFLDAIGLVLAQSYLNETDKDVLRQLCLREGLIVQGSKVYFGGGGVEGRIKNIIFAANGPKPKIVLLDATNNDIKITRNEEYCLVYDRPISAHGLRWDDLVDWWLTKSEKAYKGRIDYERDLYKRLKASLASPPEHLLFDTYFRRFRESMPTNLPALIPQVYLHYDPYTITYFQETKDLVRQRMDFLLLFSHRDRAVLEIDGVQHYSENGTPSPKLYAEMMAEDRRLKLAGYEVYRFGGHELQGDTGANLVVKFFEQLFQVRELP